MYVFNTGTFPKYEYGIFAKTGDSLYVGTKDTHYDIDEAIDVVGLSAMIVAGMCGVMPATVTVAASGSATSITAVSTRFNFTQASALTVDMDAVTTALTPSDGDVIVIGKTGTGDVTLSNTSGGSKTLVTGGYALLIHYDGDWYYQLYLSAMSEFAYFKKIGACEENPTISGSYESIITSEGDEIPKSETVEFALRDINFNKANYDALRAIKSSVCTFAYVVCGTSTQKAEVLLGLNMRIFPEISENQVTTISGSKKTSNIDNVYKSV